MSQPVPWEAGTEIEICVREMYRGMFSGPSLWRSDSGRNGQREKLSCGAIPAKVSANLLELWSWEGPQSWARAGPLYPHVHSHWMQRLWEEDMPVEELSLFSQGRVLERNSWELLMGWKMRGGLLIVSDIPETGTISSFHTLWSLAT